MKRLLVSGVAALAMVVVGASPVYAASETIHFSFRALSANAEFFSTDPSGCVTTAVFVSAEDGRVKTAPGGPVAESTAQLFVSQFDECTQTPLIEADGFAVLDPGDFQIDRKLTAATLDTTLELFDFVSGPGTSLTVDVSIAWTGAGATATEKQHSHFRAPGFKANSRFFGTFRDATATGTVTDGTTNLTPEPAGAAQLGSVKVGEVVIIHT